MSMTKRVSAGLVPLFALALLPHVAQANSLNPGVLAALSASSEEHSSSVCKAPESVPDASSTLVLLGVGLTTLLAFRRRVASPKATDQSV